MRIGEFIVGWQNGGTFASLAEYLINADPLSQQDHEYVSDVVTSRIYRAFKSGNWKTIAGMNQVLDMLRIKPVLDPKMMYLIEKWVPFMDDMLLNRLGFSQPMMSYTYNFISAREVLADISNHEISDAELAMLLDLRRLIAAILEVQSQLPTNASMSYKELVALVFEVKGA